MDFENEMRDTNWLQISHFFSCDLLISFIDNEMMCVFKLERREIFFILSRFNLLTNLPVISNRHTFRWTNRNMSYALNMQTNLKPKTTKKGVEVWIAYLICLIRFSCSKAELKRKKRSRENNSRKKLRALVMIVIMKT